MSKQRNFYTACSPKECKHFSLPWQIFVVQYLKTYGNLPNVRTAEKYFADNRFLFSFLPCPRRHELRSRLLRMLLSIKSTLHCRTWYVYEVTLALHNCLNFNSTLSWHPSYLLKIDEMKSYCKRAICVLASWWQWEGGCLLLSSVVSVSSLLKFWQETTISPPPAPPPEPGQQHGTDQAWATGGRQTIMWR